MHDYGYTEILIETKDISIFQKITNGICKKDDFYYDLKNEIDGDVSSGLHMTLFYGFINKNIDKNKFKNLVNSIKIKKLKLGKIYIMPGYQNKYQILTIKVIDTTGKLENIYNTLKSLDSKNV